MHTHTMNSQSVSHVFGCRTVAHAYVQKSCSFLNNFFNFFFFPMLPILSSVNKSYILFLARFEASLSTCFEVLYKAGAPYKTCPFGTFFFGTFACFGFIYLPCSFFLAESDESDDNYYCDNSPPKQHYWVSMCTHIDQRLLAKYSCEYHALMRPPPPPLPLNKPLSPQIYKTLGVQKNKLKQK